MIHASLGKLYLELKRINYLYKIIAIVNSVQMEGFEMSNLTTVVVLCITPALFAFIAEIIISIWGMKYIKYLAPDQCSSFKTWIYSDWNFTDMVSRPKCQVVGVRWFGFVFEKKTKIRMF